jgi:hypothetical protein
MQGDGNLCIYRGSGPPNRTGSSWCNMVTGPIGDYFLMMQSDGNLVVYRGTGPADNKGYLWGTQKTGPGGKFFLKLYDDGNLAVHQGTPENLQVTIWQTGKNAPGTPVASGAIVTLTNAVSGRQLSAHPPESLIASENSDGWEQWTFTPSVLTSFHGTRLIVENGKAFHTAYFSPTDPTVNVFAVPTTPFGMRQGDRVLVSSGGSSYVVDTGAAISVSTSQSPNAFWIIRIVGAPALGRQADKEAICGGTTVPVRSVYGTYLKFAENGRVFQGTFAGGSATPTIGPKDTITCFNEPLRFGDSVLIKWQTVDKNGTKGGAYMKPWTMMANGTWTLNWKFLDTANSRYTILPVAPYTNGARVPRNVKLLLKNEGVGMYLSAQSNQSDVYLLPQTGEQEKWEFVRQP